MFIKSLVLQILRFLAVFQLKKMSGKVIGITGSVGKTTCKDFLFELLKTKYRVKKTPKSLNSESGVPLAILNQESGYSNPFLWLKTFLGIFFTLLFDWGRLDFFVIEMGVDKPGDMEYLLKFIKSSSAIFLGVKPVHTAAFEGFADPLLAIYQEKKKLVEILSKDGIAVLNLEDEFMKDDSLLLETLDKNEVSAIDIVDSSNQARRPLAIARGRLAGRRLAGLIAISNIFSSASGLEFTLGSGAVGDDLRLQFSNVLGQGFALTLGAAAVLAKRLGIGDDVIKQSALNFKLAPGRMNLIKGIKDTIIIDSSYNASKYPMLMALDVLAEFQNRRKVAVLGDMRELGKLSQAEHEEVARKASKIAGEIVLVGPLMKEYFLPMALQGGFPKDKIYWFTDSKEAAQFVQNDLVKGGEAILVKGSQNTIFLERVVYALMLEKEKAKDLLCRQEGSWGKIRGD